MSVFAYDYRPYLLN